MQLSTPRKVKKNISGWLVPAGVPQTLKKGTQVEVMQALGDTITLATADGRLVRVDAEFAPCIGLKASDINAMPLPEAPKNQSIESQVLDQLRTCYDPEIPVNIVELGLIYKYEIKGTKKTGYTISVTMTLTAVGCGMGEVIAREIEAKIKRLPYVKSCKATVTFDPPWDQSRMSEAARLQLGLL
ncbi:MAG: DUF5963 family protein [Candidatus Andersenbacteria bacterium]